MTEKHREPQLFEDVAVRGRLSATGPIDFGLFGNGDRFFVDPLNGNDGWSGESARAALATMSAALGKCTANKGDVIVRLKGTETVTAPVEFDVAGVTVVAQEYGAPGFVKGENFMTYNSSATGLSAGVITQPTRMIGVGFAASDLSEEALLIDCEEQGGFNGGFNSLENCRFPTWNGIIACGVRTIGGALNHFIDCEFDGLFGGFATAGIIMEGDDGGITPFYPRVLGCRFMGLGSGKHAITHSTAATEALYAFNELGRSGSFLDEGGLASTGLVHTNYLGGANQAAVFSNIGSTNLRIVNNHYDE